eukprot:TRINITY_DN5528_c0_g1_i1.p1 TRINITY_DN5528_c0_g1~~TRINITY_DN5528_c0_g1_i1.p1  ORF type:complete len:456 (+),score=105.36 TRINITY_DN5528_c0_g1_i1:91-1368(+)
MVPAVMMTFWLFLMHRRLIEGQNTDAMMNGYAGAVGLAATTTTTSPPSVGRGAGAKPGGGQIEASTPAPLKTIFISVAAFRDSETKDTLLSIFSKARHPERIHVGLVCQRDASLPDEDCMPAEYKQPCEGDGFCAAKRITLKDMPYKEAKGPTYARHLASLMYSGEDYFMMIDSHNSFVRDWDLAILRDHEACSKVSPKCVLSVYPMGLDRPLKSPLEDRPYVAYLCSNAMWHGAGYPGPFRGGVYRTSAEPRPQPYLGAGLVFGAGQLVLDAPFDPHLPFLFHGEEILITTRLWTHGYDFFSPGSNILYHHYYREGKPRMESARTDWYAQQTVATKRVQFLLQLPSPSDPSKLLLDPATLPEAVTVEAAKYGMGTARTLKHYWEFARIDIAKKDHSRANDYWCDKYKGSPPYSREWRKAAGYTD